MMLVVQYHLLVGQHYKVGTGFLVAWLHSTNSATASIKLESFYFFQAVPFFFLTCDLLPQYRPFPETHTTYRPSLLSSIVWWSEHFFKPKQLIRFDSTYAVVCTDLWGKELHRPVGVGMVMTSGSLHGVMVAQWPGMPEMWVRVLL